MCIKTDFKNIGNLNYYNLANFKLMLNYVGSPHRKYEAKGLILVQVTIYMLLIGRDGHLDQSEAYDIS